MPVIQLHVDDALEERIRSAAERDGEPVLAWLLAAVTDCVIGNEDAANIVRCEACDKVLDRSGALHGTEDGVWTCATCNAKESP